MDTEAIAWAAQKLQAFAVDNSTMENALMMDRLYAMLEAAPTPPAQENEPVAWAAHDALEGFNFIGEFRELVNEHINDAIADGIPNLPYRLVPLYTRSDNLRKATEELVKYCDSPMKPEIGRCVALVNNLRAALEGE